MSPSDGEDGPSGQGNHHLSSEPRAADVVAAIHRQFSDGGLEGEEHGYLRPANTLFTCRT